MGVRPTPTDCRSPLFSSGIGRQQRHFWRTAAPLRESSSQPVRQTRSFSRPDVGHSAFDRHPVGVPRTPAPPPSPRGRSGVMHRPRHVSIFARSESLGAMSNQPDLFRPFFEAADEGALKLIHPMRRTGRRNRRAGSQPAFGEAARAGLEPVDGVESGVESSTKSTTGRSFVRVRNRSSSVFSIAAVAMTAHASATERVSRASRATERVGARGSRASSRHRAPSPTRSGA